MVTNGKLKISSYMSLDLNMFNQNMHCNLYDRKCSIHVPGLNFRLHDSHLPIGIWSSLLPESLDNVSTGLGTTGGPDCPRVLPAEPCLVKGES